LFQFFIQYCLDQEGEEKRSKDLINTEPVPVKTSSNLHMTDSLSSESEKEASASDHQGAELSMSRSDKGESTSLESSMSDSQGLDVQSSMKKKVASESSKLISSSKMHLEDSIEIDEEIEKEIQLSEKEKQEVEQGTSEVCQFESYDVVIVEPDIANIDSTATRKDLDSLTSASKDDSAAPVSDGCVATEENSVQCLEECPL